MSRRGWGYPIVVNRGQAWGQNIVRPLDVSFTGATYATSYGVIADGETDNTVALQAALDATPSGGALILPVGWIVTGPLTRTEGISLIGQGTVSTVLIPAADGDCLSLNVGNAVQKHNFLLRDFSFFPQDVRTSGAALRLGYVGSVILQDMKIGTSLGGQPYEGLRCDSVSDSTFDNLSISGCVSHNVIVEAGGAGQVCVELHFTGNCRFTSSQSGHGMLLKNTYGSSASVEGIHIDPGCVFYANALDGVHLQCDTGATMQTIHMVGAILDTNGRDGFRTSGTAAAGSVKYVVMSDCWVSSNGGAGCTLTSVLKDMRIDNGYVILNGNQGILATSVSRLRIFDVDCHDNSQSSTQTYYGMDYVTCDNLWIFGGGSYNTGNKTPKQQGVHYTTCTDTREVGLDLSVLSGQTPYLLTTITAGEVQRNLWSESDADAFLKNLGQYVVSGTSSNEQIRWASSANEANMVRWRVNGTTLERLNSAGAAVLNSWDDAGDFDIKGAYMQFLEMTAPTNGAANTVRLFSRDNGAGKTQLCVIFASGAVIPIATEV